MSDNDNPGNVIYDATVSAGEGEMAANIRAHDGVADAVTNSTDRRGAATEARNQQYKSAASSGGAKLSATFDITHESSSRLIRNKRFALFFPKSEVR